MPSRSWVVCFRIKKHKAERDVPHLLIMIPAQAKEARLRISHHSCPPRLVPSPPWLKKKKKVPLIYFGHGLVTCSVSLPLHLGGVDKMQIK